MVYFMQEQVFSRQLARVHGNCLIVIYKDYIIIKDMYLRYVVSCVYL